MTIRQLFDRRSAKKPLGQLFIIGGLLSCSAWIAPSTAATSTTVQGVLIDKECSAKAETRVGSDPSPHLEGGMLWAYTHTRSCLLMPSCQRTGYGVFAYDTTKFLIFDAAGNHKALALIQSSNKQDEHARGSDRRSARRAIKVSTLKLLP
jgi:hypothetical protein